jgi:hypothetical protein
MARTADHVDEAIDVRIPRLIPYGHGVPAGKRADVSRQVGGGRH